MKQLALALTAVILLFGAGAASAQEALAKSAGCLNCHAIDAKKVGPSFKEIASKNKGKADAEARLTAKLTSGSGHPAVKAKPEEVSALVKFVLAQ